MFKHILIPIDGTELSVAALDKSLTLARETGAKVTVLMTIEPAPIVMMAMEFTDWNQPTGKVQPPKSRLTMFWARKLNELPACSKKHQNSTLNTKMISMATAMSLVSLFSPAFFGRMDPGPGTRRRWLIGFTVLMAALFAAMGVWQLAWLDVAGPLAVGVLSGYMVLQYSDVRSAYAPAVTGRAMAVFTMALFLGVALMQWVTGVAASIAAAQGADPYVAVMLTIAAMLATGALAFRCLPVPAH